MVWFLEIRRAEVQPHTLSGLTCLEISWNFVTFLVQLGNFPLNGHFEYTIMGNKSVTLYSKCNAFGITPMIEENRKVIQAHAEMHSNVLKKKLDVHHAAVMISFSPFLCKNVNL